jgi:hypothetical protein
MSNNLSVRVTADVSSLQAQFAVARAEANSLTREMNALARQAAATGDVTGNMKLQGVASQMLDAQQKARSLATQLEQAGFSGGRFGDMTGRGAATAAREMHRLFEEIRSGSTGGAEVTMLRLSEHLLGLGPAGLVAVGSITALAAGLGYLVASSIETANALDQIKLRADMAGNLDITRDAVQQLADTMSQSAAISSKEALNIAGAIASIPNLAAPAREGVAQIAETLADQFGVAADKIGADMKRMFAPTTSVSGAAKQLEDMGLSLSQAQLNAAAAADRAGNANEQAAAKMRLVNEAAASGKDDWIKKAASIRESFGNLLAYVGLLQSGLPAEKILLDTATQAWQKRQEAIEASARAAAAAPASADLTLKAGLQVSDKENPITKQLRDARADVQRLQAAISQGASAASRFNLDDLNASLVKANEHLAEIQFGPAMERMRADMQQLAATWDGTQSGMLEKQLEIARRAAAATGASTKEHLAAVQEAARLEVEIRRATGEEAIGLARMQESAVAADTKLTVTQRLEAERDVLQQLLANEQLTAQQRIQVQTQLNEKIAELGRQAATEAAAITRSDVDTDIAISKMQLEARKSQLALDLAAHQINASQKLAIEKDLTKQIEALDVERLQAELATLQPQTAEYERVYNEIRQLRAKLNVDLAQLGKQAAADATRETRQQTTEWQRAVSEIEGAESSLVSDLISRRKSLSQSLLAIGAQMLQQELANDLKALTTKLALQNSEKALEQGGFVYHEIVEMMKARATQTAQAQQTLAVNAGNTARETSDAAAATQGRAQQAAVLGPAIDADAAKTFSGVYGAISGIPYVGPFLAPAMAAAAEETVMSKAASLDVGAWNVPKDMYARIHEGESVVPRDFADGMRASMAGGRDSRGSNNSGATHNYGDIGAIHVSDTSLKRMLQSRSNQHALQGALVDSLRRAHRRGVRP